MPPVFLELDGIVLDKLEAPIVLDEIGHEQTRKIVVDVRKFEDSVDDCRRRSASARFYEKFNCVLNEG